MAVSPGMRSFLPEKGNTEDTCLLVYHSIMSPWVYTLLLPCTYRMTWNTSYKLAVLCTIFINEHGINHIFQSNHFSRNN